MNVSTRQGLFKLCELMLEGPVTDEGLALLGNRKGRHEVCLQSRFVTVECLIQLLVHTPSINCIAGAQWASRAAVSAEELRELLEASHTARADGIECVSTLELGDVRWFGSMKGGGETGLHAPAS